MTYIILSPPFPSNYNTKSTIYIAVGFPGRGRVFGCEGLEWVKQGVIQLHHGITGRILTVPYCAIELLRRTKNSRHCHVSNAKGNHFISE